MLKKLDLADSYVSTGIPDCRTRILVLDFLLTEPFRPGLLPAYSKKRLPCIDSRAVFEEESMRQKSQKKYFSPIWACHLELASPESLMK